MFTELLAKAFNISEKVEMYILKIGEGLAVDHKCSIEDIDVNIKFKNNKAYFYFYVNREYVKTLTKEDIEHYCLK